MAITTDSTETAYESIQKAIKSFTSKTNAERLEIQNTVNEWRIQSIRSGLAPTDLWYLLKAKGLKVDIFTAIVLCDTETGLLREAIFSEADELGATEDEIDKALLDLSDAVLCA